MGWWPFGATGGSKTGEGRITSEFDASVPPPPSGAYIPPPEPPRSLRPIFGAPSGKPVKEFTGFTPPPPATTPPPSSSSTSAPSAPSSISSFSSLFAPKPATTRDYDSADFSKYTSQINESDGLSDHKYASTTSYADTVFTNPRARACWESVKMGGKMGATVGSIFGGLTGVYASIANRSFLYLPVSLVGGAVSFGFFLGCGMLVRCDDGSRADRSGSAKKA